MNGTSFKFMTKITGKVARSIICLLLMLIGIAGSSQLLLSHTITEASFVALIMMTVVVGLVIFFENRISSFSLKDGSVSLEKIEATRIEVESKREEIERLAYLTVRLVVASQEAQATFGMTDGVDAEFRSAAKAILEQSGIDPSDELFNKIEKIKRMDVIA